MSVAAYGIRIYDQPAGQTDLDDKYLLVSILKQDICLAELQPLFRDTQAAQEVLDEFNRIKLDARMAGVDTTWRMIVMPDAGLALVRTLSHYSTHYPYRYLPIAVCIRSNGAYLYRQPLSRQHQPKVEELFLYIIPQHIEPQHLQELFSVMLAAEITAVYRFNRKQLMRVLQKQPGISDMPAAQEKR